MSYEALPCEIITVSANDGEMCKNEAWSADEYSYPDSKQPSEHPDKPIVFLSSRVHCGETVASYFLQGIYSFLASESEQAKQLLSQFCFKIVPCLNPDGVLRGYWRTDCTGTNMNRVYSDPDP